jgi:hypothetical protein
MEGFVVYDTFYHVDHRTGPPSYLDMRGVKLPTKLHDCSEFEFSRVRQIAVGGIREDPLKNYLAAWVGDEVYVYLISHVSAQGMLDKKLWTIKAPEGFKGFDSSKSLAYSTPSGSFILTLK